MAAFVEGKWLQEFSIFVYAVAFLEYFNIVTQELSNIIIVLIMMINELSHCALFR